MGFDFSDIENGIQSGFHDLLWLGSDLGVLSKNDFFGFLSFSVEHDFAPFIYDFGEIKVFEGLSRV